MIFFWIRYEILHAKNKQLEQDATNSNKLLDIQAKVIDVTQNTSSTDLDGTLERLRNNKL